MPSVKIVTGNERELAWTSNPNVFDNTCHQNFTSSRSKSNHFETFLFNSLRCSNDVLKSFTVGQFLYGHSPFILNNIDCPHNIHIACIDSPIKCLLIQKSKPFVVINLLLVLLINFLLIESICFDGHLMMGSYCFGNVWFTEGIINRHHFVR